MFMTRIPAEVCDRLRVYLDNARLDKSAAVFFKESIAKLDEKVVMSYFNGIFRLTELFAAELKSSNWSVISSHRADLSSATAASDVEDQICQLDERLEWLCSVANDSVRLRDMDIRLVPGYHERLDSSASTQYSFQRIIHACNFNIDLAADQISCIIFQKLSYSCDDDFWTNDQIHLKWLLSSTPASSSTTNTNSAPVDSSTEYSLTHFCTQLHDLRDFLIQVADFMEPFCYYRLLCICAAKVSIRYIYMLRFAVASDHHRIVTQGLEVQQIKSQCESIVACFSMIERKFLTSISEFGDIQTQFLALKSIPILVTEDILSPEFNEALQSLLKLAEQHPSGNSKEEAAALCRFVETCLKLRNDVRMEDIIMPRFAIVASVPTKGKPMTSSSSSLSSKYSTLNTFFDTINYLFPETSSSTAGHDIDSDTSFVLRLSRVFPSHTTVPSREELERHLYLSVFLIQANSTSKQQQTNAKVTNTISNLFKDSKTPTGSGHSASHLIPTNKFMKALSRTIRVTGLRAENLETSFSKPKAFFKISLDSNTVKTTSIKSNSAFPSWVDEEFIFVVDDLERASLTFKLHFEGAMYGSYEVGFFQVSLGTLDISAIDDITLPINPIRGSSSTSSMDHFHSGSVKVSIHLV